MIEIEKTFLVKKVPKKLELLKFYKMKQGYISSTSPALRIRQKGNNFELTKKIPLKEGDFSSFNEINIPLSKEEFEKLWPLVEKSLKKTRYLIPLNGNLVAELDVFEGELKGLSFVEVEFESQKEMDSFIAPNWFGRDVTQEKFSANVFLAGKSFNEIKENLF